MTPTEPEGWVLVPREPTEAMLHGAELADQSCDDWRDGWRSIWSAMLEAAPASHPSGEGALRKALIAEAREWLEASPKRSTPRWLITRLVAALEEGR